MDVSSLLGDDHEAFESVVTGASDGPLAVVGAPFAGRETVLDAAAERLDADRVRLRPDASDNRPAGPGDGPVVVDDCQHLYERTIGGFDALERFLEGVARADAPVVTGWNRYAWAYLAATQGVDREFPVRVELGPVAPGDLAELVLERYGEPFGFRPDESADGGPVEIRRRAIGWRGHTRSIPYPVLDLSAVTTARRGGDTDPKDVVFERLAAVSGGNAGVATAIWDRGRGGERRPSSIVAPGTDRTLDREEAFCLRILLAKEAVERAELARILEDGLERILGRLVRDDLIEVEGDRVRLRPAAVPTVLDETERRGLL